MGKEKMLKAPNPDKDARRPGGGGGIIITNPPRFCAAPCALAPRPSERVPPSLLFFDHLHPRARRDGVARARDGPPGAAAPLLRRDPARYELDAVHSFVPFFF